jgi:hypothetical protein
LRKSIASIIAGLVALLGALVGATTPAQAALAAPLSSVAASSGTDWDCVYAAAPGTNPGLCIENRRFVNANNKLVVTYTASHEAMPSDYTDFAGTLTLRNNNRKVRWRTWFQHNNGTTPRAWQHFTRIKTRFGYARLTGEFTKKDGTTVSINRAWRIG